jgi:hypothetical protein
MFAILEDAAGCADLERRARALFGDLLWTSQCETPAPS